jgi:hypothetical protein
MTHKTKRKLAWQNNKVSRPSASSLGKNIKPTRYKHCHKDQVSQGSHPNKRQVQMKPICSQQRWQHKRKCANKIDKITKSVCSQQQWHPKENAEQG